MYKNVLEWLEKTIIQCPEKVAYVDSSRSASFSEVYNNAKRIGSALKVINDSAPIAVFGMRNISTIEAYFGIVYSGHSYAPIDAELPEQRIKTIMEFLKPSAILVDSSFVEVAQQHANGIPVITIEGAKTSEIDEEYLRNVRNEMVSTDPLYIIFTSGSTGVPKGVITSHYSLMCYIESYADVMGICAEDIIGNQSPLDYIAAIRDIYLPILKGAASILIPKELFMDPNDLFEFLNDNKITSVGWSVSAFTIPLKLGAFEEVKLETLNKVCFSGSVMPSSCLAVWQENLPNALFVNQYGPTEATASCTYYKVDHKVKSDEKILIGKPYNNYHVFLLDSKLSPTPNGEIGEICVSGPILALGYYNDPERTKNSFILNPNNNGFPERIYRTGDYGRIREDGMMEFHGRMDRQIKHMGHRVELDEIECAANQIKGMSESVALYNADTETIYLFYSGNLNKKALAIGLRQTLPGFMVPRKLIQLDSLPKLANGKIDMKSLKEEM